jgi:hypothetical protein
MKFCDRLLALFFFCGLAAVGFALDREALTFTNYDLNVRIEPEQQRLGVRGKIILRNDSAAPQRFAVLQISSSLDWRSITSAGKPVQFVTQPYTSDIDHTGMLSEAVVTLPATLAPGGSIELEIGYEGVIVLDATRLLRIDTPESIAHSSDWDQIGKNFTAVRGVGYVAWYPISTVAEDLSDPNDSLDAASRWKKRESLSRIHLHLEVVRSQNGGVYRLVLDNPSCVQIQEHPTGSELSVADCLYQPVGLPVPTFIAAEYQLLETAGLRVYYFSGHDAAAASYSETAEKLTPLINEWFGALHGKAQTADLMDPDSAPFESGAFLLTSLTSLDPKNAGLLAVHQLTHAAISSPREWINEGLPHLAQAVYVQEQKGHQAALEYLASHSSIFLAAEKTSPTKPEEEASRSLINTNDEQLSRSKSMYVWWMLRDLVGDAALKKAFSAYRPEQDNEPSYLPRLIQAQTQRDLEWFFDDWVYRDRGLPDFKVDSAFTRKTLPEGFLITVTVENLGAAGAEVPLTVKFTGGEISKRLLVRGKNKGVIRVEVPKTPEEVVVNDGSVPESDLTNNTFKIQPGNTEP